MTGAIVAGLVAGVATIGISELVLKVWASRPVEAVWKLTLVGVALRTAWVLSVLITFLAVGGENREAFVPALLAGYLGAQVWEGFRYQRAMASK
jgi:hypothetical protein